MTKKKGGGARREPGADARDRQLERLHVVCEMAAAVQQDADPRTVYERALDALQRAIGADRASVLLFDAGQVMRFVASRGLSASYLRAVEGHTPWTPGQRDASPITVPDTADERLLGSAAPAIAAEGIRALAFIPLVGGAGLIGKFMVYYDTPHIFTVDEIVVAETIARNISAAIEARRIEDALRASEKRLARVLVGTNDGFWDWNVVTGEVLYSRRWAEMFGYRVEDLEPHLRAWEALVHPEDLPGVWKVLNAHLEGRTESYETEQRIRTASGEWLWVLDRGKVVERDDQGRPLRAAGTHTDISARKRAEEALLTERRLFTGGPTVVFKWRNVPGWPVEYVSPNVATQFGYQPEELTSGRVPYAEIVHPDDLARVGEEVRAHTAAGAASFEQEYRFRRADGEYRSVYDFTVVARDEGGQASHYHGYLLDVTGNRRAVEALRAGEERLKLALSSAGMGIYDWHLPTGKVWYSEPPGRLFGTEAGGYYRRYQDFLAEVHPEDRQVIANAFEHSRRTGRDLDVEFRLTAGKARSRWFWSRGQVYRDAAGTPVRMLGISADITARKVAESERRQIEHQIEQAQKLESLGVLAGGIAHDFNNLLTGVLGNASMAQMELAPDHPARTTVDDIATSARRAADLTRQLLAYSGKGRFVIEQLDLSRVVEEMLQLLATVVSKRASLRCHLAPSLPPVEADATQVRQIVMNLITNASDALEERTGVISITTGTTRVDRDYLAGAQVGADCPEGRYAFLEVADTGVGMSPETVGRIFEPFFTTKFTGRGLGLAATLGIVRGHRGALKVYSEPGQGSTFKLLLPVAEASPEPPVISAASIGPAVRAGTVLVVDDEPAIRAVARRILESASFGVLEAVDGREAVRMIREHGPRIHLILLDLTMPELSGEEAFREIRKLDGEVAVLLSSGYNEQETVVRFAGKGLTGFIQKPYSAQELLGAVRRALAGRKGPAEPDVSTP